MEENELIKQGTWEVRLKDRKKHPQIRCGQPWFKWTWKRWTGTPMITKQEHPARWERELKAEFVTDGDLKKSIPQLVCDFNDAVEEAIGKGIPMDSEYLLKAQRRMVAMMANVAISNNRLTWVLIILTIIILILSVVPIFRC
jgi:hypothetical protein